MCNRKKLQRFTFWSFLVALQLGYQADIAAQIFPFQNSHWAFGDSNGLKISCYGAFPSASSSAGWGGASSSIADNRGNLLFHVNSRKVWTSDHTQMPNGFGLPNDSSVRQSGLIVPQPANSDMYFIFHNDARVFIAIPLCLNLTLFFNSI